MHETSLAMNLLEMSIEEMRKHGKSTLVSIHLACGTLANVVPEALQMGFQIASKGSAQEQAVLHIRAIPLRLACGGCGREYEPEVSYAAVFAPCPFCGEEIGHRVLAGKELYIEKLEVE